MVKFNEMMTYSSGYNNRLSPDKWTIIENLYQNVDKFNAQKIPRKIHQIWLGGKVPDTVLKMIETVKKANPNFLHCLWTDDDANEFEFKNKSLFNKCKNYGQKSDILRYAILERFGGIYLDTDFISIKSFDSLLGLDFFTGIAYDREPNMFNGLIGCIPEHPIIKSLNNITEVSDVDGMAVIKTTGPWFLTRRFFENLNSTDNCAVLPVEYFYPLPNFIQDKTKGNDYRQYITDKTICVHLWDSRWN